MSNFFQNMQNHGFWSFDFWFLFRGKKADVNTFYTNGSTSLRKNERISLSPTQYHASKFVILPQSDSWVEEKMVNYWPEIYKLLPRDRKHVALYTVTI